MSIYQFNTITAAGIGGFAFQQVLGGNSRRLSLIVGGDTSTIVRINDGNGGATLRCYAQVLTVPTTVIAYRDYGTIMQGEIWVATGIAVPNLFITEIYLVRH